MVPLILIFNDAAMDPDGGISIFAGGVVIVSGIDITLTNAADSVDTVIVEPDRVE